MTSTNDPDDPSSGQEDHDQFTVANLALWAGDAEAAKDRLSTIVQQHHATQGAVSPFEMPLVSSSQRALRQLRRRLSEFRRLGQIADLAPENLVPQKPLQSRGKHVSAIIWVESEREFELRSYLNDLSWEAGFYKAAATLAGDTTMSANVANLHYGSDEERSPSPTQEDPTSASGTLGVEWALTIRDMFLQVSVSDFCTFTARGIWVSKVPPESVGQITSIFQELLDNFDPGP